MEDPRVKRVRAADAYLHDALFPYDELRPREGVDERVFEKWHEARQALMEAEKRLDTGLGGPTDPAGAMPFIRQAREAVEWTRGLMAFQPTAVKDGFARALRELDGLIERG
jgi:hypothetical protein